MLLGGCSYKAGSFFEDLFAENSVVKAEGQYKGSVAADAHAPIIQTRSQKAYAAIQKKARTYRGKIAAVHFDRDFNLYAYTFIDNLTHAPVTFYYDKNIQSNRYGGDYRVTISGNYLIRYEQIQPTSSRHSGKSATQKPRAVEHKTVKKYKRRKRSSIKVPVEEKISPL